MAEIYHLIFFIAMSASLTFLFNFVADLTSYSYLCSNTSTRVCVCVWCVCVCLCLRLGDNWCACVCVYVCVCPVCVGGGGQAVGLGLRRRVDERGVQLDKGRVDNVSFGGNGRER